MPCGSAGTRERYSLGRRNVYDFAVMRILFLAPHPFYQERGTPIAVNLLLEALSQAGHTVDLLTYHEGSDVRYAGLTIHRIAHPPFVRRVGPGPTWKKIVCDLAMTRAASRLARKNAYDLVHAVEESAFMAASIRRRRGVPYLYDMDSSMGRQIVEKFGFFSFLLPVLMRIERIPLRGALAVVPMCDALAGIARAEGARQVFVLRDVSLLGPVDLAARDALAARLPAGPRFMYVGNLERYQGIDLLLDSFAIFSRQGGNASLVVAGGTDTDINRCRRKAASLGLGGSVVFIGPQPVGNMAALFDLADVLVSPRIKGNNTPMKIYSYLASGKAVLATDLPTHTQVLTPGVALLAPPEADAFAAAMSTLAGDPALRAQLGAAGRALADRNYSADAFRRTVREIYAWVEGRLTRAEDREMTS